MSQPLPRGPLLSFQSRQALKLVGKNLRTARLRRGESESLAAQRTGVSRHTWRRLEAGEPSVSLGLLFEALTIYGFTEQLFELANPDLDTEGKAHDAARRPKRGRG
ncbi:MAG TPA: helix-turn-helix transcriptional regulator [Burkholderiaceae bacterium]|nr:helix-turn-helix transcriptional regulator [Burkholderiaceae bacterium]